MKKLAGQSNPRDRPRGAAGSDRLVEDLVCRVALSRNGHAVAQTEQVISSHATGAAIVTTELRVDRPELWYPNVSGAQPLYELQLRLYDGADRVLDEWTGQTGFRTMEWIANEQAPDGALPYTIVVNGQKTYIRGVNLTPLDLLYGTVDEAAYRATVRRMKEANVNLVRVWGGGNELTDESGAPITERDENIAMLRRLVDLHDPGRTFLPTSASGPNEYMAKQVLLRSD